jgi:VanZ family protein
MKTQYRYIGIITWMAIIFLLSSEVSTTSSGRSDVIVHILTSSLHANLPQEILTFLTRKAAHIVAYFILGVLTYNLVKTYKLNRGHVILLSIAFAFSYATFDEAHQLFVPGRSGEIRDVFIDISASTLSICIYYFIHKRRSSRINSNNKV